MIELTAKLVRGPVYLAGELLECNVTFRNQASPEHTRSHSNSDSFENLAWASVQIHCICSVNENKVIAQNTLAPVAGNLPSTSKDTSYVPCKGETGEVVLSTKPKILFCDLRLAKGDSKTFLYSEVLPSEGPPSFRGQSVKYSYKLTVGVQRLNLPIRMLKVPFRVLVIQGLSHTPQSIESEDMTPSNPFVESQPKESALELALEDLQNVTARRSPNFYNITSSKGKVVRFCLFKQAYKLGEDIVGTYDFTDTDVPCVQLSVALQSEEEVAPERRKNPQQKPSVLAYGKAHEVCLGFSHSHLCLPIPLHLPPTFSTDLVSLRWRLHFEFVTSLEPLDTSCPPPIPPTSDDPSSDKGTFWHGPPTIPIETMIWDLPVTIYPSNPQLVGQGIRAQSRHSMVF